MSTSLRLEAGVDKRTNEHPVDLSVLTLLVGCQEEHPAGKKWNNSVLVWLSV